MSTKTLYDGRGGIAEVAAQQAVEDVWHNRLDHAYEHVVRATAKILDSRIAVRDSITS